MIPTGMKIPRMVRIERKWFLAAAAAAALVAGIYIAVRPAPVPVDTAPVLSGPLQLTLDEEGRARVRERFVVAAPVSGRLDRIGAVEGDAVRTGMPLAAVFPPELDAREHRAAVLMAKAAGAALEEASERQKKVSIDAEQAGRKAMRYRALYAEGAVSRESFELARNDSAMLQKERLSARAALQSARFRYESQQAAVDRALGRRPVYALSPVDGRVLLVHEKSARVVAAGTPLLEVGDPATLEIVIDLLSSDAVKVGIGDRVEILDWGGADQLSGTVHRIEPAAVTKMSALGVEERRVNVIARLDQPEPDLGDNFRVQARIVLATADHVLKIPVSALFRAGGGWHLFLVDNGRVQEKAVKIGLLGAREAELLSGIPAGAYVVLHPSSDLRDGVRVVERK